MNVLKMKVINIFYRILLNVKMKFVKIWAENIQQILKILQFAIQLIYVQMRIVFTPIRSLIMLMSALLNVSMFGIECIHLHFKKIIRFVILIMGMLNIVHLVKKVSKSIVWYLIVSVLRHVRVEMIKLLFMFHMKNRMFV